MKKGGLRQQKFEEVRRMATAQALAAGMINVSSVIVFFAFASNITGHFAILAQELSKGNWFQAAVAVVWLSLFFFGNFVANLFIVHKVGRLKRKRRANIPLLIEAVGLVMVGVYLQFYYSETLAETEFLVGSLLFIMGLQNGHSAGLSGFSVKTTHLTGLTTDLGVLLAMFTKKRNRANQSLVERCRLSFRIMGSYVIGGILGGVSYHLIGAGLFYIVALLLLGVILYPVILSYSSNLIRSRGLEAERQSLAGVSVDKKSTLNNKRDIPAAA